MKLPFFSRKGERNKLGGLWRRLAVWAGIALVVCYLSLVTGGYLWLHQVRKVEQVRLLDIATFNLRGVRRSMAVEQFALGKREWDAKNYRAAYVAYASAVRRDPDNVVGRLEAARFFQAVGAPLMAQTLLEEGLALAPQDERLIKATFEVTLATGQNQQVLKLLHTLYPAGFTGPNALALQSYEVFATLAQDGPLPAKQLLDRYPALLRDVSSAPMVARVCWEANDKPKALEVLANYVRTPAAPYGEYVRLAKWQRGEGLNAEAIKTAESAGDRFPGNLEAPLLLMEMRLATRPDGRPPFEEIEAYLRDHGDRPEALTRLAALAGNHGWVDLTRILYELGVVRQGDLVALAFSHSDALMTRSRYGEARLLLTQLETQARDGDFAFAILLRQRQVIAAAALGDTANVHEYAQRLRSALGDNAGGLDFCRRLFAKLGIAEAVAELAPRPVRPSTVAARK